MLENFTVFFQFATVIFTVKVFYPTEWTEEISGATYRVFDAQYNFEEQGNVGLLKKKNISVKF